MSEKKSDRISGRFVWYAGYLFLKADEGSLEDMRTILSIEPGVSNEITTEALDVSCVGVGHLPFVPEDLKEEGFEAVYRMHPRSIAIPTRNDYLEGLLGNALKEALIPWLIKRSNPQPESHERQSSCSEPPEDVFNRMLQGAKDLLYYIAVQPAGTVLDPVTKSAVQETEGYRLAVAAIKKAEHLQTLKQCEDSRASIAP